ncbi:MAG: (d)CMP kinase, partial [Clostridia bacterium]|nr:(d)CMP kinase [Clostridia bacterium]
MIKIAIDGPSGAGKSTVAKALAAKMGIVYVDTGALYRTVGYAAVTAGISTKDAKALEALLPTIKVDVRYENGVQCVYLNGENLGDKIRRPEISMAASDVSAIPAVRAFLLDTQRDIAKRNSVVMDGRDIGTVILPDQSVLQNVELALGLSGVGKAERRRRAKKALEEVGLADQLHKKPSQMSGG